MNVSRPTVVRAYDYANRDEAAAAAREGRSPTRPPYRWSKESRSAKRKPRDARLQLEPVALAGACVTGFLRQDVARAEAEVSRLWINSLLDRRDAIPGAQLP